MKAYGDFPLSAREEITLMAAVNHWRLAERGRDQLEAVHQLKLVVSQIASDMVDAINELPERRTRGRLPAGTL